MYSRDAPVRDSFAGYALAVDPKEPAQREELLIELLRLQSELGSTARA